MFKSIQTKIMFFLVALAFAILIILGFLLVTTVEAIAVKKQEESLKSRGALMANIIEERLSKDGVSIEDKNILKNLKVEEEERLILTDKSQTKVYNLSFKEKTTVQEVYKNEKDYVAAVSKINGEDEFLILEISKSVAYKNVNNLKNIAIVLVVITLFIMWCIGKRISFAIQKPIKALSVAAAKIAEGDISNGIEIKERGELLQIAESFNQMLHNLKSVMQQALDKSGEAASMHEIMEYIEESYDELPSGILSINNIGEITTFNKVAEGLTGLSAKELVGIDIKNPTPQEIRSLIGALRRCLSRGSLQLKTITDVNNTKGETIPVVYSINIQFGAQEEVLGAICVFRRIEDIETFEESAQRARSLEALGEMAASLAHEIKNPMTSIRGYTQYIQADLSDKGIKIDELDIIIHEVDRLANMLDEFLKFARPKRLCLKNLDVRKLIDYAVLLVSRELPENILIETNYKPIPQVMADREQLEAVILNLILNAIQAMQLGGRINISTTYNQKRDMVCIEVQDSGHGIPQGLSSKIFQPFFTTKEEGTGMGLAICARIVEAHKGVMEIESIEGEMTKFSVLLQGVKES